MLGVTETRARRLSWSLAALAVAASITATNASARSIAPQQLVLRLTDLPAGFALDRKQTGPRSNAAVARDTSSTLSQLKRWGRIGGYQATFTREPTLRGLLAGSLEVQSLASVYRTARGAAASFVQSRTVCKKSPFTRLSIGARLGHGAVYCSMQQRRSGQKITVYLLAWRRGSVTAAILLGGLAGVVDPTEAVTLAHKQDARIARALRH